MTKKTYFVYKIIAASLTSVVVGVSATYGNWYLPVICLVAATGFLFALKSRVNEVMADERDYKIAGRAAELAIRIYGITAAIVGVALYIVERGSGVLFVVGSVLLYSACVLMLLYAVLFKIYAKKDEHD
jgi:uncharacterized membrane protein